MAGEPAREMVIGDAINKRPALVSIRRSAGEPRAGDRIRTDDNNVGNVVLYQLSYTRKKCSRVGRSARGRHSIGL